MKHRDSVTSRVLSVLIVAAVIAAMAMACVETHRAAVAAEDLAGQMHELNTHAAQASHAMTGLVETLTVLNATLSRCDRRSDINIDIDTGAHNVPFSTVDMTASARSYSRSTDVPKTAAMIQTITPDVLHAIPGED